MSFSNLLLVMSLCFLGIIIFNSLKGVVLKKRRQKIQRDIESRLNIKDI